MAILDTVKIAQRIRHDKLDDELTRQIAAARLELSRVGVSETRANSDDGLIIEAIVTYCLWKNAENSDYIEKYRAAFALQADGLRKDVQDV